MGIFRKFIVDFETGELPKSPEGEVPDNGLITIPNAMTLARPIVAAEVSRKLIKGQKGIKFGTTVVVASDMEGKVGRWLDENLPQLDLGSSKIGEKADPIADTMAILEIGAAAMLAPRVPVMGKVAIFATLGQEGIKAGWAITRARQYNEVVNDGDMLNIPVSIAGKEAMAEKFTAVGLALLASDSDNQYVRQSLSIAALGFAGVGVYQAEKARAEYEEQFQDMMRELPDSDSEMVRAE